ncbi:replication-associated recombination protein A [Methylomonas koyamae]|uniref:Replication-associated recombination protein A n=1 Tax=Methylomonas koyamae TaxID=702114 RepID=A0A291IFX1_9GAMM|nr:replication-associated recombination protein A [Methylomonas koyamae]ATG89149.1 recombination factor protein RarA [Methylomonas koyamae]OAI24119.1 recombination factor protein RarA [Methylomonas koyamae]
MNKDAFDINPHAPLAARMRPTNLDQYIGQQHLLAKGKSLRAAIDQGAPHSLVFWGPPGVGKTTLAKIIAASAHCHFIELSAVMAGVKEIRAAVAEAEDVKLSRNLNTVVFIDEIHRFSKSQQDSLLAPIESGAIILFGATTENPSFELNNALLSRLRVYVMRSIDADDLLNLLHNALTDPVRGLGSRNLVIDDEVLLMIAKAADGDARRCLNILQIAADLAENIDGKDVVNREVLDEVLQGHAARFDKGGDIFYDQISALHKSVRGTDPDAALYWFCRMIDGGCDPLYIARRVVRMASEDIGNADPRGLELALNAAHAYERLGSPEGELSLAQAIVYLACAPKSNAVYVAYKAAMTDARTSGSLEVPMHLRNAPTKLMKELGHGAEYRYAHDEKNAYAAGENYFPEPLIGKRYYVPVERGLEIKIKEKLEFLRKQ